VTDPREMLSCREVVELVTSYIEGALTAAEEVRFEEHLALCDGCAAYVDQMRRTIVLVGRLDPEAVDPEAGDRLMLAFRGWAGGPQGPDGG